MEQQGNLTSWIKTNIGPDGFSTYQREPAQPTPAPTPRPDPRAAAIKALYDAVPVIDMDRATQLVDPMMAGLAAAQCTNVNRIAMALAQWGEESDGFNTTVEYGDQSAAAYYPYIGRTWIQITWKSNYAAFGAWCVAQGLLDDAGYFVNNPAALGDIKWAGIGPAWYWTAARPTINELCDAGDIVGVTQLINGGRDGIDQRRARYQQALALGDELLALIPTAQPPSTGGPLMALSDADQQELLDKVRFIFDQVGPKLAAWGAGSSFGTAPDGSELTERDGLIAKLNAIEAAVAQPAAGSACQISKWMTSQ